MKLFLLFSALRCSSGIASVHQNHHLLLSRYNFEKLNKKKKKKMKEECSAILKVHYIIIVSKTLLSLHDVSLVSLSG